MELLSEHRRAARACLSGIVLTILSCQPAPNDYREYLFVYATLNPQLRHQVVIVDKSYPVDEPAPESTGVSGATVLLQSLPAGDSCFLPESTRFGFYTDTAAVSFVQPNSEYLLYVRWHEFEGQVQLSVPDTFSITRPLPNETLRIADLPIFTWRRSTRCAGYRLFLLNRTQSQDSLFLLPVQVTDTFLDPRPYALGLFPRIGRYTLKVYALDQRLFRPSSAVDTIGENVLAQVGAMTIDSLDLTVRQ